MIARALIAALALSACTEPPPPPADEASCAVYRAFYAALPPYGTNLIQDTTATHVISTDGGSTAAPTTFQGGDIFFGREENSPRIALDTSAFFEQVATQPAARITNCFEPNSVQFIDRDFRYPAEAPRPPSTWQVSPVAFAPDEQHALIVAVMGCGESCGDGTFYLLQRNGDDWTLIGRKVIFDVHS